MDDVGVPSAEQHCEVVEPVKEHEMLLVSDDKDRVDKLADDGRNETGRMRLNMRAPPMKWEPNYTHAGLLRTKKMPHTAVADSPIEFWGSLQRKDSNP